MTRLYDAATIGNVVTAALVRALQDPGALASDAPLRDLLERGIRASMEQLAGE